MKAKNIIITLLITYSSMGFLTKAGKEIYDIKIPTVEEEVKADEYFRDKKFNEAFKLYKEMSNFGDKYAQYKLSQHYLYGFGVQKDLSKAYAWANLAAQNGNLKLIENKKKIYEEIPISEKNEALMVSNKYYEKYNDLQLLSYYKGLLSRSLPRCTGSRIRGNVISCEKVKVSCAGISDAGYNHERTKACQKAASKMTPENIRMIRSSIKEVKEQIDKIGKRKGKVTVKMDESND